MIESDASYEMADFKGLGAEGCMYNYLSDLTVSRLFK